MNNYLFAISISFALSACTVGNGMICGPQTPAAYCDKEAYQSLMHPKRYIEHWEKSDMTTDGRMQDWIDCGGRSNGNFSPYHAQVIEEKRSDEKGTDASYKRLSDKLQRCILKKGYHYTGHCDNQIMKAEPACGALQ